MVGVGQRRRQTPKKWTQKVEGVEFGEGDVPPPQLRRGPPPLKKTQRICANCVGRFFDKVDAIASLRPPGGATGSMGTIITSTRYRNYWFVYVFNSGR